MATLLAGLLGGTSYLWLAGSSAGAGSISQLSRLVATNQPCRVQLQPVWKGTSRVTLCTGSFTNAISFESKWLGSSLRFDWFRYTDKSSRLHFGPATIGRGKAGNAEAEIHTYRPTLPTDAELKTISTGPTLEKLLGPAQGLADVWGVENDMRTTLHWSFFALRGENAIETLSIDWEVTRRAGSDDDWQVVGLRTEGGTAAPGGL